MTPHDDMIATWKQDPAFRQEYDALGEEFALFDALVSARQQAGLTQMEVAERMGTKTPAVARLEAGGGRQHHAPSLATLRKYAPQWGAVWRSNLFPSPLLLSKSEGRLGGTNERSRDCPTPQPSETCSADRVALATGDTGAGDLASATYGCRLGIVRH